MSTPECLAHKLLHCWSRRKKTHLDHEEKPLPPIVSVQLLLLTELIIMAEGKEKCLQGPAPIFQARQWRLDSELRCNKLITDTVYLLATQLPQAAFYIDYKLLYDNKSTLHSTNIQLSFLQGKKLLSLFPQHKKKHCPNNHHTHYWL